MDLRPSSIARPGPHVNIRQGGLFYSHIDFGEYYVELWTLMVNGAPTSGAQAPPGCMRKVDMLLNR